MKGGISLDKKKQHKIFSEAEQEFFQTYHLINKGHHIFILNESMEIIYPTTRIETHHEKTNSNVIFHKTFSQLIQACIVDGIVPYLFTKIKCFSLIQEEYDGSIEQAYIDGNHYIILSIRESEKTVICETHLESFHAQLLLGQLASGYVHEIRNPLTSIKGFIQLLQAGIKQEEQYYKVMIAEIDKIEYITNQLLQIGKPVSNEAIQLEPIASMIDDVVHLFQMNMAMRKISFHLAINERIHIKCNRMQVKQALINLIKNAAEAMDYEGNIHIVDQYIYPDTYELKITDEGPGISKQIIERLGEPFISTKQKGTGLGLMLSKEMIEKNNGTLEIKKNVNRGTCVQILFSL